jgi:N-acetylmuramoyl-L-alanine amidase
MIPNVLIYLVKMMLISGFLWAYYRIFLKDRPFHQYNRFFLLGSVLVALLLPLCNIPLSGFREEPHGLAIPLLRVVSSGWEEKILNTEKKLPTTSFLSWTNVLLILYAAGFLIFLFSLLNSLLQIRKLARLHRFEWIQDIRFFQTSAPGTPFSFFKLIFWNRALDIQSGEGQKILRHEMFHVRQQHSLDILFLEGMTTLFWFNPLLYFVKREIRALHEFLADQHAIAGSNRYVYAKLLVEQSIGNKRAYLTNPFFHNHIKRRITMITKASKHRFGFLSKAMILPLLLILFSTFAFKLKTEQAGPSFSSLDPGSSLKSITVVVDAGHGGLDPGANNKMGISEKDLNLSIAQKIAHLGKSYNVTVIMTRDGDYLPGNATDISTGLRKRTEITSENKASLFVSIHANYDPVESVHGFEVFVSAEKRNNPFLDKSRVLGSVLLSGLKNIYAANDHLQQSEEKGIWVLDHAPCPAVLIECGNLNNSQDLSFMSKEENQDRIAKEILEDIVKFSQTN